MNVIEKKFTICENSFVLNGTKFEDCDGVTYGYRLSDDYAFFYYNDFSGSNEKITGLDLMLFAIGTGEDETAREILYSIAKNKSGVKIDGVMYGWNEIKTKYCPEFLKDLELIATQENTTN